MQQSSYVNLKGLLIVFLNAGQSGKSKSVEIVSYTAMWLSGAKEYRRENRTQRIWKVMNILGSSTMTNLLVPWLVLC